ncbi:MAG: hypothetical protein AAFR30_16330 [Cyanobacteria bacterium J06628_4]
MGTDGVRNLTIPDCSLGLKHFLQYVSRNMYRAAANGLAGLILLVTLSYSLLLADEINTVALWDFGIRGLVTLFGVGPLATLAVLTVAWRGSCHPIPTRLILFLNSAGLLLLALLIIQTLSHPHGLWIEKTVQERHFCNCLFRYHLFPPYVGTIGVYLSVVGYLSYRKLSSFFRLHSIAVLCRFASFLPITVYYSLILWHQWIPRPRFIG